MQSIEALASQCRVATPRDTVLHSECAFTFHSPYSSDLGGIVVNLNNFMGTIQELAFQNMDETKTTRGIFLRIVKKRIKKDVSMTMTTEEEEKAVPTKLAIGVEGGFATDDDKYETQTVYSVVVLENPNSSTSAVVVVAEVPYEKEKFSEAIVKSVESIINHVGLAVQQDLTAWQDDEPIPVSKYYQDLPFVDNGIKISPDPKAWKCEKRGDTENLWLNLSDGYIGGGRQNWDGSGGSNGALDHFKETGEKYPLVVKLGTITAEGSNVSADCFSYAKDEDGPVQIPNLKELLAKRGINVAGLQKTEKSTAELEVELNANYAFDAITESGSKLVPVTGPGLQGLQNLGNSCYMNSIIQLLCTVPELSGRYGSTASGDVTDHKFFSGITPKTAPDDLLVQMAKLATALTSGAYALPTDELNSEEPTHPKYRLAPRMFKHLVGKDHVDFKTAQQQDAAQFLQYLLEQLDRAELKKDRNLTKTSHIFSFGTQAKLVCSADQKIKYKDNAAETIWSLRIPMDKAVQLPTEEEPEQKKQRQEGEEEKAIPTVKFSDCLDAWAAESTVDDIRWPHLQNSVHQASQTTRIQNFPRYLWVQIQRYQLGPDWQPIKLEVNLDIPEELDLTEYRAKGPQDGEELVPEVDESTPAPSGPEISEVALSMLMDMGFTMNGCKRALTAVGGSDTEAAMTWIFEHNMDPDFNDPLPEPSSSAPASSGSSSGVDDAVVMSLVDSLGCFTIDQVRAALKETNGAADRAADWLFSHMDDLDASIAALAAKNENVESSSKVPPEDGEGKYSIVGMVSHIGKNTGSGHYVAHIKRDGKWTIFNDEKVAISENPPLQHAYLYLFQRTDTIGSPHSGF